MELNLWFKITQTTLLVFALAQHTHFPWHDHASYCCVALIVFFLVCRYLSPLSGRSFDDEFDDTDEELYYLQKCQASKPSLFIPSTIPLCHSCSLLLHLDNNDSSVTCCGSWIPLSSAWPVIAIVNRWNPLAWVGVVWALICLLIHACLSCLLCLELCQVWFIGDELERWWTCPTVCVS